MLGLIFGILSLKLYRLGVFAIGQCLGLVSQYSTSLIITDQENRIWTYLQFILNWLNLVLYYLEIDVWTLFRLAIIFPSVSSTHFLTSLTPYNLHNKTHLSSKKITTLIHLNWIFRSLRYLYSARQFMSILTGTQLIRESKFIFPYTAYRRLFICPLVRIFLSIPFPTRFHLH